MIEKEFIIWLITKQKIELLNFTSIPSEKEMKDFLNKMYLKWKKL
jgi:hypothetical protein